jgi:hypothetical protein
MGRGRGDQSVTKRSRSMPLEPGQLWGWERLDRLSPQRRQIDLGIRLPLMLSLARILGLILVRLRGIRAATFLHDTIMLRTTAVAHTITHIGIVPYPGIPVKS